MHYSQFTILNSLFSIHNAQFTMHNFFDALFFAERSAKGDNTMHNFLLQTDQITSREDKVWPERERMRVQAVHKEPAKQGRASSAYRRYSLSWLRSRQRASG